MSDEVLVYPDRMLRQTALDVDEITPEVRERALGLIQLMNARDGIGLAAPQVGWLARIVVIKTTERPGVWGKDVVLVNPRIHARDGGKQEDTEGCLSFPGIEVKVERDHEVTVEAQDIDGKMTWICAEGLVARCLQHELDHLDGVLFIDRLTPARRVAMKRRLREMEERS